MSRWRGYTRRPGGPALNAIVVTNPRVLDQADALDADFKRTQRVKEAGALVLAKSNMAEWASTPYETVSSIPPGYTKNPYALDRVTAGSSGGTAAAVFQVIVGEETIVVMNGSRGSTSGA